VSIQRIGPEDIELFTLRVNPRRTYTSSSIPGETGVTGSVQLFPQRSDIEKEVRPLSAFSSSFHSDDDLELMLEGIRRDTSADIRESMQKYLDFVNDQSTSARKQKTLDVIRFEPTVSFTTDTQRKNIIRNTLYPYYRPAMSSPHWAYTNYHTLNFFTASSVPSNTALLYPNVLTRTVSSTSVSGAYVVGPAFTFEFYLNPRYSTDTPGDDFKAGTLLHLSSTYAVSLVSGSSRDADGRPDGFRLLLQVSGAADTLPSQAADGDDLTFMSADNSLLRNRWHHCAIRWSKDMNHGTGSFVIDGDDAGTFVIPSASIAPNVSVRGNPDVLVVGNYYDGPNTGSNLIASFFNENTALRDGLVTLIDHGDTSVSTPATFQLQHPLNAEVHELRVHGTYRSKEQLALSSAKGSASTGSLLFYVPPFFTRESPTRAPFGEDGYGNTLGGVQQTPFFAASGTTDDPFNVAMSFGVAGHLLNLENFVRDFITGNYPRLFHLTASNIGATLSSARTANALLYDEGDFFNSGSVRKRNVTVLPNDNGRFIPDFSLLLTGSSLSVSPGTSLEKFTNDLGNLDLSLISLTDMVMTSSMHQGLIPQSGSLFDALAGATPEDPGVDPGSILSVYQRTRDESSNEVVFFDISNVFYGSQIEPETLILTDEHVSGTDGKVKVTLRDNGRGGLYRADALTDHPVWASVGDVFYNEGIVVIKSPNVPFFGKDAYELVFQGRRDIYIMRLHVPARAGELNSSSNPTYIETSASNLAHETDARFVYLTGLNFMDDNLNVIMKTRFAQPIIKRAQDRLLTRVKIDW